MIGPKFLNGNSPMRPRSQSEPASPSGMTDPFPTFAYKMQRVGRDGISFSLDSSDLRTKNESLT